MGTGKSGLRKSTGSARTFETENAMTEFEIQVVSGTIERGKRSAFAIQLHIGAD